MPKEAFSVMIWRKDTMYKKETICIQSGWKPKNGEPRLLPIYQSTTFKYESSEQMEIGRAHV